MLENDVVFNFDELCLQTFEELKASLTSASIVASPDWSQLFDLMCDAKGYAIGTILGQLVNKVCHTIYYVSNTLICSVCYGQIQILLKGCQSHCSHISFCLKILAAKERCQTQTYSVGIDTIGV